MKKAIIIQARMTSTRLPGKVMMDLAGRPMLAQQIARLKRCREVRDIVIATTVNDADNPVVELAKSEGIRCFRGDEQDVLSRFLGAARQEEADLIVRLTADCPLIDPGLIDQIIHQIEAHRHECDYASNVIERTFPRGLDAEAFFFDTLERIDRLASSTPAREHVTWLILREHPELFLTRSVVDSTINSDLRWTVDVQEDLDMLRRLYQELNLASSFKSYADIRAYVRAHPAIAAMNATVAQKVL